MPDIDSQCNRCAPHRRAFMGKALAAGAVSATMLNSARAVDAHSVVPNAMQGAAADAFFYVTAYGALGNGTTDDTAAVQSAIGNVSSNLLDQGGPNKIVTANLLT